MIVRRDTQRASMKVYAVALAMCGLVTACSTVRHAQNCTHICDRYEQCVDSSVDNRTCTRTCRAKGDEDDAFTKQAEACKQCLDGRSCVEAASCVLKCVSVILKST